MSRRAVVWDALLSLGGVVLVGLTFKAYRYYQPLDNQAALVGFSDSEADHRIADAKGLIASHPEDIQAWSELAVGYYQKGPSFYVDGLNALEKARTLGSVDQSLPFYSGVMYATVGLPDYAVNEFKKYLRYYPDHYETQVRLANVYFQMEKYDEADTLYRQIMSHYPKDPTVWFNDAVVCIKKGRLDEAQAALSHVQSLVGQLPPGGYFYEGEIARLKNDDTSALKFYDQERQRQPNDLPTLEAIEQLQRQERNYKEANALRKTITDLKHQKTNG